MQSGDDPEEFLFVMDGYRDRLEKMGQSVPDERYEDIIFRALPVKYDRVRIASCERRDFNLSDLRYMVSTMYADYLSRLDATNSVAGRAVAMQASGRNDGSKINRVTCYHCGKQGHVRRNCPARSAARALTGGDGQDGGNNVNVGKWCYFHSVMVDSGVSGHYFDDTLIPGLRYKLHNYQELATSRAITTAGGHQLAGVGKGLLRGHIQDGEGVKRLVQVSCLVVPGMGRNLFSVKQATRNGVVSIFEMNNPRLETNKFTVPLQELESDLYFFSLELSSGNDASRLAVQAADAVTLWHRRMGHLNSNSLNLLKNVGSNGVDLGGAVPDCNICAVGKSHELAHPKTANNKVQHAFEVVMTYLMGLTMPEALGGFKYACKISDEYSRWTEIYLQKTKDGTLHAIQSYVQSTVIPSGVRVEGRRAGKDGESIGNEFKSYCRQTGILLEFASTNTPQQIGLSERVGRTLADMVRCMLADSGLQTFLWGELMFTAAYLANRSPRSALDI
ncbi:unnamed protein product [Sphacelaria rigidula]